MLNRQYGVAAPSAVVKVTHPEDNQPNEGLHGRDNRAPPRLADTSQPSRYNRKASFSDQKSHSRPTVGPGFNSGSRHGRGQERSVGPSGSASWRRPPASAVPRPQGMRNEHRSTSASDRKHSLNSRPVPIALPTRTRAEPAMGPPLPTRTQQGTAAISHMLKSPSPKLPAEPLRRRTYHELPSRPQLLSQPFGSQTESGQPLLPGRKRPSPDFALSQPPPSQRVKLDQDEDQSAVSNRVSTYSVSLPNSPPSEPTNRSANSIAPATSDMKRPFRSQSTLPGPSAAFSGHTRSIPEACNLSMQASSSSRKL
ncbi:hypothetical protein CPB83DRAFT_261719 [Crepidotus variabilis]|uniref:Uncharacterized protein n=1 Tax=Crepidotus variabilis TaxID=179855 RepID=A0A9P6JR86_9AGAR|nr:hypothetical protein CPB83DRAFT_261719 [Crepidotus variabilis]